MIVVGLLLALGLPPRQPEPPSVWRVARMPAEHHPCLLFSADQLPAMRERMGRPPYSGWWQGVSRSDDMVSQALTWRLTGDEEKAKAVRERLLRCNPTGYHCSCGVADALQGVAEAYDLIYDYAGLSETDHRVIRAKIANACERLYLSALETGSGQHPGNQRTRGICALGTAAMVLAGYQDAAHTPQEWLQRALDGIHEDRNLEFWRDDGMFIEGPTYSAFTLSVMLPFARYYRNFTGQWLFDDPRLKNALEYLVYVTQPDGYSNAMGTTNMENVVNSLQLCIGAGDPRDQAAFRWALDEWGSLSGGVREFCLFDDSVKPSICALPTARIFPVSQEVSWRNEWSRDALALWFKGKDPWIAGGYTVYSHGDVGSFVLHAYGELLAVDAGYDHWVSRNLYPANLHNTLLVDGEGPTSETTGVLENVIDAGFIRAADVVTEYAGVKLRRTFLLVEDQFIVIVDDVESPEEHDYTWQIHTPVSCDGGQVNVEGNRAWWTGFDPRTGNPGHAVVEACWAGDVDVEAVEGSRWQPYSADPQTGSYDNWTVLARQRGKSVKFLTVLYPHAAERNVRPERWAREGLEVFVPGSPEGGTRVRLGEVDPETWPDKESGGRLTVMRWVSPLEWMYTGGPGRVEQYGRTLLELSGPGAAAALVAYHRNNVNPVGRVHLNCPADSTITIPRWEAEPVYAVLPSGEDLGQFTVTGIDSMAVTVPEALTGPTGFCVQSELAPWPPAPPPFRVVSVRADDTELPPGDIVDLGRVSQAPKTVEVAFEREDRRKAAPSVTARLDGEVAWRFLTSGPSAKPKLQLPEVVAPTEHELVFTLTDGWPLATRSQLNLRFSLAPLLANGGFEDAGGWSFGDWSRDERTKYEIEPVADDPHSGKRCLMMRGIAGSLNMTAAQTAPLELGTTCVLRGYYRGDAPARASLCNQAGTGQYIWSPAIGPSAEWVPFEREFTVENPDTPLIVALRLGQVGAAYFDDLELAEKAGGG
jgi:hypothetical protein